LILIKDKGIIATYKSTDDEKNITVLGELSHNLANKQVKRFEGIIYWSKDMPLLKQVGVLKKICPSVNSIPNSELLKNIKGTEKWKFGEFLPEEAEELITKAEENKLNISIVAF
jgi:hypothetical protein